MRKAAGIILIILGLWLLFFSFLVIVIERSINTYTLVSILWMVCSAFLVAGGILCLKKKYLELCWGSAFLAAFFYIGTLVVSFTGWTWLNWICAILGTIPIIFVSLRNSEWKEISDSVDGKVTYNG